MECPTHSAKESDLWQVAAEISRRLDAHFLARIKTAAVRSPADWKFSRAIRTGAICILFYEYFHGDNGAGIGASHQTGWTGLVAKLIEQSGE